MLVFRNRVTRVPLLAVVSLISFGLVVHVSSSTAHAFSGGTGTVGDPYLVSTCAELAAIDDSTANLAKSYELTGNIDCSATSFSPLVNGTTYFSGVLNGTNKTISNFSLNCSTNYCGLFARLNGGTVKNLRFTAPSVTSSAKQVGLIAGYGTGALLIDNILVNGGTVTNTYAASATLHGDESMTGGILGQYQSATATISNITSSLVVSGKSATGGILGSGTGNGLLTMSDVSVSGDVSGLRSVGGLIGTYSSSLSNGLVLTRGTVNASSVTGLGQSIGGILGYGWNVTIENSFSSADVAGKASGTAVGIDVGTGQGAYVGGVVGQISGGDSTIRDTGTTGDVLGDGVDGSVVADGVAGIIGWARLTNLYVTRSYHRGSVTGARGVGAIAGMRGARIVVTDSYFRSDLTVTDTTTTMVGGLIGQNSGVLSVVRSYYAGTQSGLTAANRAAIAKYDSFSYVTCTGFFFDSELLGSDKTSLTTGRCGGNAGPSSQTTSAMKLESTYSASLWDFTAGTGVWALNSSINNGYPYLANTGGQDTTPPTASWTAPASPTASRSLSYTLTFSESVSGISSGDFSNTGTATGCVFTPSAASTATSITVTVMCSSDGTVIARLAANAVSNSLSTTGPSSAAIATSVLIDTVVATTTTVVSSSSTVSPNATTAPASGNGSGGGSTSDSSTTTTPKGIGASTSTVAPSTGKQSNTTTTQPTTETTVVALQKIDLPEISVGEAAALYRGKKIDATITRQNNELSLKVGPIAARIWAITSTGAKVPLDETGRLRLKPTDSVTVDIEGFDSKTQIEVRLYSDPLLLGRSLVDIDGRLSASYEIPTGIESGNHKVVLSGLAADDPLTFALSVAVGKNEKSTPIAIWISVPLVLAILSALILPVALRRRRRTPSALS